MTTPLYHFEVRQEFTPVGCVPPALYRTGGVSVQGDSLSGGSLSKGGGVSVRETPFPSVRRMTDRQV